MSHTTTITTTTKQKRDPKALVEGALSLATGYADLADKRKRELEESKRRIVELENKILNNKSNNPPLDDDWMDKMTESMTRLTTRFQRETSEYSEGRSLRDR